MEKARHLSASDREQDRKKKRKIRRIVLSILIVFLIAGIAAELIILKNMASSDRMFIRAVERGVAAGWEESKADLQLKERGRITDTSFIQVELENVEDFRNKAYKNKELGRLAGRYISALKECSLAAQTYDPADDSGEFWKHFSEPYTERLLVLRKLYTGDYAMGNSWDNYPEALDEVLLRSWVAETAGSLRFKAAESEGPKKFVASFKNDSGVDIAYLNIDINLFDKEDKLAATAEVVKEDIKDGQEVQLEFYYGGKKLSAYRINAVDCIAAERAEDEKEEN